MVLVKRTKKTANSRVSDDSDPEDEVAVVEAEKLKHEVDELKEHVKKVRMTFLSGTRSQSLAE
jgi:hypothetical protein